jgi:peptide/nickel transport system substrate-binding protein
VNSIRSGAVISPKAAAYAAVESVEARDARTVVFHLKRPDNFLLTNLSTGAFGIVPEGSGREFWRHPVGTGPFRFVSQQIDQEVLVERNPLSWAAEPKIERARFRVVPDAITESLEIEKGSADVAVNSLPMDSLAALATRPNLVVEDAPGTQVQYLGFNLRDPLLKDVRVRQAIAFAIDRNLIIQTLLRGHAQPAESLLPPSHWAFTGDVARYPYDPARATPGRPGRNSLSPDDEDRQRRGCAPAGGRAPTATGQGGHCARSAQLRIRHFLFRRDARRLSDVLAALDRRR